MEIIGMTPPAISEKVAFLSRPDAYSDGSPLVEIRETHMSWVFLTKSHAWKLKKPVRTDYLDFSTTEARRRNCLREVRLNRRLANDVYLGVVPLTLDTHGDLQLDGSGKIVDWLVQMRRLPAGRMLDSLIARHAVSNEEVVRLASTLATFYLHAQKVAMTGPQYRRRLAADLQSAKRALTSTGYPSTAKLAEHVIHSQLDFLDKHRDLVEKRAREARIIDAHGDLRPEHICMERRPVIIDCLEFNRNLRILDAVCDLAFLALECERLGAAEIGESLVQVYRDQTGDSPSEELVRFYRAYHATVRAKIALWHLNDDAILDKSRWVTKGEHYLQLAGSLAAA
jgi:aminoglycoside phosphotransferase family enzyme